MMWAGAAKGHRFEFPQTACKQAGFLTPLRCGLVAATQWLPVDATARADCAHEKDLQMQAFLPF
jgi:hypothetical protein